MAGHDALPKQCRIDAWEIPMVLRADPFSLLWPLSPISSPPLPATTSSWHGFVWWGRASWYESGCHALAQPLPATWQAVPACSFPLLPVHRCWPCTV